MKKTLKVLILENVTSNLNELMCFHPILETHFWTWTKYLLFKEFGFFFYYMITS